MIGMIAPKGLETPTSIPPEPIYAMFTRDEMERRYQAAWDLMDRRNLDALLITGEENFQYFVGTSATLGHHYSLARPSACIVPLGQDPIVITQKKDRFVLGSHVTDIREYVNVLKFPHEPVVQALRDGGLAHQRVGVELGQEQRMGIPVGSYLAIVADMPKVQFVDAADVVIRLRMIKSEQEIAYMQKAADITGKARRRLYQESIVVPGMTERGVARAMRRLILEEGGDRTSFVNLQHDLPGAKSQFHYERPLTRGMVLAVDTGAFYWMYTIDYVRFATLGVATAEQKRVHELVKEINASMSEALGPGVKCSELHQLAVRAIAEAGAEPDSPQRLTGSRFGHGQGMLLTEPPSIHPHDDTELEPGMVLSTEPGIRSNGVSFLWEDVHVITEDGHRQLTHESDELVEIPF